MLVSFLCIHYKTIKKFADSIIFISGILKILPFSRALEWLLTSKVEDKANVKPFVFLIPGGKSVIFYRPTN